MFVFVLTLLILFGFCIEMVGVDTVLHQTQVTAGKVAIAIQNLLVYFENISNKTVNRLLINEIKYHKQKGGIGCTKNV